MSLFSPQTVTAHPLPAVHPGEPVFVVGDVHGQPRAFAAVLRLADEMVRTGRARRVVFLGDLVDRGSDSLACLSMLAEFRETHDTILLLGNHEQFMFATLEHPDARVRDAAVFNWVRNGGRWAVSLWSELPGLLQKMNLGLGQWQSHFQSGNALFVHAGIPAQRSDEEITRFLALDKLAFPRGNGTSHGHWAWIRIGFLESVEPWPGHYVVHGHTKREFTGRPHAGRLNLDATADQQIAAALVEDGRVELFVIDDE